MGGQGKSRLALAYCELQKDKADIFWFDASSESSVTKDMAKVARVLDPSFTVVDVEEQARFTRTWLSQSTKPWLVVFDNHDDPDSDIERYMPETKHGLIIITTRHRHDGLAEEKLQIQLRGLTDTDALKLLSEISGKAMHVAEGDDGRNQGLNIIERLGRHALAIAQAGGIIKIRQESLSKYIRRFEREKEKILGELSRKTTTDYRKKSDIKDQKIMVSVFTTLELSWIQLQNTDRLEEARDLLTLLAYFDSRDVSERLLEAYCNHGTATGLFANKVEMQPLQSNGETILNETQRHRLESLPGVFLDNHAGNWDTGDFNEVQDALLCVSLLEVVYRTDDDSCHLALHPVVGDWIRTWTSSSVSLSYSSIATTCIYRRLCEIPWKHNRYVVSLPERLEISSHLKATIRNKKEFFPTSQAIPTLGLPAADIGRPELYFGRLTDDNGQDEESEIWFRQSLHLREKEGALGPDHPDTLTSIDSLVQSLSRQGKYAEAEQTHHLNLEKRTQILGQNHPDTLTSMNNLAEALYRRAKWPESEKIHKQALKLRETVLGPGDPDTLTSMTNLADVFRDKGEYPKAEKIYRKALAIAKKTRPEHPDTLSTMSSLATVLNDHGQYNEAEKLHRETLLLRERVMGAKHPDTLTSSSKLATVLDRLGRDTEAEHLHRQTLETRMEVLGAEHPNTATSMSNLASVLSKLGKYHEAEELRLQTLMLDRKLLGSEHPHTLTGMSHLATVLSSQGKYSEAEKMRRELLDLDRKVLGLEHPDTLSSQSHLAIILGYQGKLEGAKELHQKTLDARRRVLRLNHPYTLASACSLASILNRQKMYETAEELHRKTLSLREANLPSEHPDILISKAELATNLCDQAKYTEAERIHSETLILREKKLGVEHPDTLKSIQRLAQLFQRQGSYEQSSALFQRACNGYNKIFGADHPITSECLAQFRSMKGKRKLPVDYTPREADIA
jgi:tetratricopeptide (TPR) repeat protein